MYIAFLIIFAVMCAREMVMVVFGIKKRKNPSDVVTEKMKCKLYYRIIVGTWGYYTIPVLIMCFVGGISLAELGFRPIVLNDNTWFTIITLALSGLAFAFFVFELVVSLVSKKAKEQNSEIGADEYGILPRTKKERWLFSAVSLNSAVCEEVVFRGFLLFLLYAIFPEISIFLVALIAFAVFGLGHLYQGLKGVIETGLMGTLFMCLFIATDSLILVMLLHFFVDFSSTFALSKEPLQEK